MLRLITSIAIWLFFCIVKSVQYTDADFAFGKHSLRNKNGFCDGECVDDSQDPTALVRPKNYKSSYPGIVFRPAVLTYTNSPVCIPSVAEFLIDNTQDHDIQLYAVISDNTQFHPVLFQPQTLPSQHSLTVQLLFLPYYVESTNSTLTVSSSEGETYYTVRGSAVGNAYQLHPFVGNRIPSGVAYEQPLVIYNPFADVLFIREVFTTEDFLTLRGAPIEKQMKMTEANSPGTTIDKGKQSTVSAVKSAYWEVEAGTRKEIIRLSMASSVPGDYHGYIHVKTSRDNIVIPVDLYVVEGGLVAVPEVLNFGVMTSASESSNLELWIQNNGLVDVLVTDIIPVEPDRHLILIPADKETNQPTVIKAGEKSMIGQILYVAEVAGYFQNKLLVVTTHPNPVLATIEVVYEGIVMRGGVGFEQAQTIFYIPVGITAASVNSGSFQDQGDGASGASGNSTSLPISGAVEIPTDSRMPSSSTPTNVGTSRKSLTAGSTSPDTVDTTNATFEVSAAAGNVTVGDYSSVLPIDGFIEGRQTIVLQSVIDRTFTFTNYFSAPVSLDAVSSSTCADMILILAVPSDNVAQPLEEWPPVVLQFNHEKAIMSLINEQRVKKSDLQLPFNCWLELWTNVSAHRIPLHIVDGSITLAYHDVATVGTKPAVPEPGKTSKKNRNRKESPKSSDYIYLDEAVSNLDIGPISAISPKPVLVVATNFNPYRVPITVLQADLNITMCYVANWVTNLNTADKDHVSYHVANSLGLKLPNASRTVFPQYGQCIHFDPLSEQGAGRPPNNATKSNATKASRTSLPSSNGGANFVHLAGNFVEENLFNMTTQQYDNSLFVESGCATLFSVTFHGRFPMAADNSSGNVTNSSVSTTTPKNRDSVLISSRGIFSSKKSGSSTQPIGLENLTETSLSFKTPHQVFGLDVRFQPVSGALISAVHPGNRTFVLGQHNPMVVHTVSTFPDELSINSLSSYSNHYFIAPLSLSFINHNSEAARNGSASISSASVSTWGQPMVSLIPQQLCTFINISNGETDLYSCMKQILTVLRRNATSATHLDGYSNFNVVGDISDVTKRRAFDALIHRINAVQNHLGNIYSLIDAHQSIVKLKVAWSNVFPVGYQLPAGEISMKTPLTHHVVQVPPTYVLTPIVLLPDVTQITLSVTKPEQITVFYIRCQNPFSVPITFRLHDLNKNKQTSLVGSKIWKAIPSEIMDLFKWPLFSTFLPANDVYLQDNVDGLSSLKETFFKQTGADGGENDEEAAYTPEADASVGSPNEMMNLPGKSFGFLGDSLPNSNPSSGGTTGSGGRTNRRGLRGFTARSQKSRRMGIIEGVEYRTMVREDTSPDLTYFSAVKTSQPVNSGSASDSSGSSGSTKQQQQKSPFVVHPSVASCEWITAAHSVALVGPIAFIPSLAPGLNPNSLSGDNSNGYTISDVLATYETTMYIMNNYTGVERVDISASSGSPAIHVQSLETSSYDEGKYNSPVVLAMYDKNGVDTSTIDISGKSDSMLNASVVRYNTSPGNAAWGFSITSLFSHHPRPPHWIPLSSNASIKTIQLMPADNSSSDKQPSSVKANVEEIEVAYALSVSDLNQRVVVQVKNTGKVAFEMADVLVNERSVCSNDEHWNAQNLESGRSNGDDQVHYDDDMDLYDEAKGSDYRFLYSPRWGMSGIASRPSPTASYVWKFGESASILPNESVNNFADASENSTLKSYRIRNSFNSPKSRCEVKDLDVVLLNESIPVAGNYTFIVNAFPHCPVHGPLTAETLQLSLIPFSSLVDNTFDTSLDGGMLTFSVYLEPSKKLVEYCSQHPRPFPTHLFSNSYYHSGAIKPDRSILPIPLALIIVIGLLAAAALLYKYRALLVVRAPSVPAKPNRSVKAVSESTTTAGTTSGGEKKRYNNSSVTATSSSSDSTSPVDGQVEKSQDETGNISINGNSITDGKAVNGKHNAGKDIINRNKKDDKENGKFSGQTSADMPQVTNNRQSRQVAPPRNPPAEKAIPQSLAAAKPSTSPVATTTVAPAASGTTEKAKKKGNAVVPDIKSAISNTKSSTISFSSQGTGKSADATPTGPAPVSKTGKITQAVGSSQGKGKKAHDAHTASSDVAQTSTDLPRTSLKSSVSESSKVHDKGTGEPSNEKGKGTKLSRSNSGKEKVATSVDVAASSADISSSKGRGSVAATSITTSSGSSSGSQAAAADVIASFNGQGMTKRTGVSKTRIIVTETNSTEDAANAVVAPPEDIPLTAIPLNESLYSANDSLFMSATSTDPLANTSSLFSSMNIFEGSGSGDLSDVSRPIDPSLTSYVLSDTPEEYALPSLNPRDGGRATAFGSTGYDLTTTGPSLTAWSDMPSYSAHMDHGPPGLTASPGRSFHTANDSVNGTGMEHMVSGLIGSGTATRETLSLSTPHGSVASLQDHSYDKMLSLSPLSPRHFSPSASSPPTDELPLEENGTALDANDAQSHRRMERSTSLSAPDELDANSGAFVPQTGRTTSGFSSDVHTEQALQRSVDHPLHSQSIEQSVSDLFAEHSGSARPTSYGITYEDQLYQQQRRVPFAQQQADFRDTNALEQSGVSATRDNRINMYALSHGYTGNATGTQGDRFHARTAGAGKSAWPVGGRESESSSRAVFDWLKNTATTDTTPPSHPSSGDVGKRDGQLHYLDSHTAHSHPSRSSYSARNSSYMASTTAYGGAGYTPSSPFAGSQPYDGVDHIHPGEGATGIRAVEGSAGSDNDSIVNWLKGSSSNREDFTAQNAQIAQNAYIARHTRHTGSSSSDPFSPPPPGMSPLMTRTGSTNLPASSYYGSSGHGSYGSGTSATPAVNVYDYINRYKKSPTQPSMSSPVQPASPQASGAGAFTSSPAHEEYYSFLNQNDRAVSQHLRPPLSSGGGSPHDQYQPPVAGSLHVPHTADSIVSRLDGFSSGVGASPGTSSVASNHSVQHNPLPPMASDGDNSTSINDDDSVASSLTAASSPI